MTCTEAAEVLHDYLDGALPPLLRQGTETHLKDCPRCAASFRAAACMRRLLRRLPRQTMPDPLKHTLLDALRSFHPQPGSPPDTVSTQ